MRNILNPINSIINQISDYDPTESDYFWKSRQGIYFFAASALVMLVVSTAPFTFVCQIALAYCSVQVFSLMRSIYRNRSESKATLLQKLPTILLILAAIYTASPFILALTTFSIYLSHTKLSKSWKSYVPHSLQGRFFQKKSTANLPALTRSFLKSLNTAVNEVFSYEVLERPYFWKSTQGLYFFATSVSLILLLTVSPYALITRLVVAYCSERTFRLIRLISQNRTESKALLWQTFPRVLLLFTAIFTFSPFLLSLTTFSIFLSHTKFSKLWEKYLPQKLSEEDSKVSGTHSQPAHSKGVPATPKKAPGTPVASSPKSSIPESSIPVRKQPYNGFPYSPKEEPNHFGFGNANIAHETSSTAKGLIPAVPEKLKEFYQQFRKFASGASDDQLKNHLSNLKNQTDLESVLKNFIEDFSVYAHGKVDNNTDAQESSEFLSSLIPDFRYLINNPYSRNFPAEKKQLIAEKIATVNTLVLCYLCSCCVANDNSPEKLSLLLSNVTCANNFAHNFYSQAAAFLSLKRIKPGKGNGRSKENHEKKVATFFKLFEVLLRINLSPSTSDDLREEISAVSLSSVKRFNMESNQLSEIFKDFASPQENSHGLDTSSSL